MPCASNNDPTAVRTGRGYGHTKYDTLDKVEMKNLHLAAANHTRILFRVANEEDWNPRRKTKEEIDEFIKEQGYDRTIALADEMREYIKKNYAKIHPETEEWMKRGGAW